MSYEPEPGQRFIIEPAQEVEPNNAPLWAILLLILVGVVLLPFVLSLLVGLAIGS